jgi:hypothetical protein
MLRLTLKRLRPVIHYAVRAPGDGNESAAR